jgi:hypothetical protein
VRIELLGPSGVGKTTLLAAADARSTAPTPWIGPAEVDSLVGGPPNNDQLREAVDRPELREFLERSIEAVSRSRMLPSQKIKALTILRASCAQSAAIDRLRLDRPIVHDELLLHRAFSLLLYSENVESDAEWYFDLVPLPDAVGVFRADRASILARARERPRMPNVYFGLDTAGLHEIIDRSIALSEVAATVIGRRDVPVTYIDTTAEVAVAATRLNEFIANATRGNGSRGDFDDMDDATSEIRDRLLEASASFRKKAGRHELRTKNVMYCAFSTPKFSISREESQRDAETRIAHFGLTEKNVSGRSVLDLGSNAGAMLFQLSNFAPGSGLGIEYDNDKVELANEIAEFAQIPNLRFEQGDIDGLTSEATGVFDIVLALAIESHVQDPDHLYTLLGEVTGDLLCFEGNSGCDMDEVKTKLRAAGFTHFADLGFCDDDRDPRNNRRPQLLASRHPVKSPAKGWLRSRFGGNRSAALVKKRADRA